MSSSVTTSWCEMISTKKNTKYKEHWIEKIFSIKIGSYIHDDTQIRFTGSFAHDAENQRAQQYELVAKELDYNDTFIIHANRYILCNLKYSVRPFFGTL